MKKVLTFIALGFSLSGYTQIWKTLPKGVRILGYRNVITSKINSNFNQHGSPTELGARFPVDAAMLDKLPAFNGALRENLSPEAFDSFLFGEYQVDASAQVNVHGTGFGYGITNKVMFYLEASYYDARVDAKLKRTKNNTYNKTAEKIEAENRGSLEAAVAANITNLPDINEQVIQSYVTNAMGYKPLGAWHGTGYGDMETGLMINAVDKGVWGVMVYPGLVLPTGRQDDPDILQDIAFGDGQYDIFSEVAAGYVFNDYFLTGSSFRYTYQAATSKTLRVPTERDSTIAEEKGNFAVKYGDRVNWMLNLTYRMNDWISFTPLYRFMYQLPAQYQSDYGAADEFLAYKSDRREHQVQFTTTLSSIQPFLKKKFMLPAQININLVKTVSGMNVPNVARFEMEFRMLF